MRSFLLCLLAVVPLAAAEPGDKTHQDFRKEAVAAYQRKDYSAAREATLAALDLRPDSPRYLYNLAALSVLTNDTATALDTLRQLAALGVVLPIERDPDFAKLQATPEFADAWVSHWEPSLQNAPLVWAVKAVYAVMIPGIMLGLVLHILLHLWRLRTHR